MASAACARPPVPWTRCGLARVRAEHISKASPLTRWRNAHQAPAMGRHVLGAGDKTCQAVPRGWGGQEEQAALQEWWGLWTRYSRGAAGVSGRQMGSGPWGSGKRQAEVGRSCGQCGRRGCVSADTRWARSSRTGSTLWRATRPTPSRTCWTHTQAAWAARSPRPTRSSPSTSSWTARWAPSPGQAAPCSQP